MPSIDSTTSTNDRQTAESGLSHLLVIEDDTEVRNALVDAIARPNRKVHHAASLTLARQILSHYPINLVLIDLSLPDGNGLLFAEEVRSQYPQTSAMIVTGHVTFEAALAAMRAGAVDFIPKPLNVADLNSRIDTALDRQYTRQKKQQRVDRLRRLCKELNQARHQISQQVDVLCADLVTAYQDLASQVQHIEITADLRNALAEELDLEQALRRTLEFLIAKIGPSNIAIFLPANHGEHSVGGYVNYSFERDQMSLILDHLVDELAPLIEDTSVLLHFFSDQQLEEYLPRTTAWLAGQDVIAVACRDDQNESLAGIAMFRDSAEPFTKESIELLEAAAPLLAGHLCKVIRIHHRNEQLFGGEHGDDSELAA